MYKHILIATDGSELAQKAVEQGLQLAKLTSAKATVVTVTEPWSATVSGDMVIAFPIDDYEKTTAAEAEKILSGAQTTAAKLGVTCTTQHVKDRYPAEGIIESCTAAGCDLIVMASHGRRGISRLLLGSQTNRVVTLSTVPVLVCR